MSVSALASAFALGTALVLGVLVAARPSLAQTASPQPNRWEVRVTSGAFVPTGDQRNSLENAGTTAAQVSWMVRPALAMMVGLRIKRQQATQN